MTAPLRDRPQSEGAPVGADEVYGVTPELEEAVRVALEANDRPRLGALIGGLYPAEAADVIERLSPEERRLFVVGMWDRLDPEILPELDETIRDEVIRLVDVKKLAAAISELDTDDALAVIADLEEMQRETLLAELPPPERLALEQGLTYPEYTDGRLMQRGLVAVPGFWTVGETIDWLRAGRDLPDDFYDIFVVDPRHRPTGTVPLSRILRSRRPVKIADIMQAEVTTIPVGMDQEALAFVFRQQDLVSAPVIDDSGRLIGVVTVDDVVDVIEEEAEDDLMKLGGVSERDLYRAALDTAWARAPWLAVNLGTAFLAAAVIDQFRDTIAQIVALAVLMPIVTALGGNAGTQALTVAVRALATRDLTATNAPRIIGKEAIVGGANGLLMAVLVGVVAWLWFGSVALGAVIAAAMVINMLVAGLAGVSIPVALDRLRIDPAVASSVFLTTVTDVVGFLAFLGLASLVLL